MNNSGDVVRDNSYLSDINKRNTTTLTYENPQQYEEAPVSYQLPSQTAGRRHDHPSNVVPNTPYEQLETEYIRSPEVYDQLAR